MPPAHSRRSLMRGRGPSRSSRAARALRPGGGSDHPGPTGEPSALTERLPCGSAESMSVGEDVLLDVRLRSAQSSPASAGDRGWLSSAPEGAHHRGLAGQAETGRCASLCLKTPSLICSPIYQAHSVITFFTVQEMSQRKAAWFPRYRNLITVSDEMTIPVRRAMCSGLICAAVRRARNWRRCVRHDICMPAGGSRRSSRGQKAGGVRDDGTGTWSREFFL